MSKRFSEPDLEKMQRAAARSTRAVSHPTENFSDPRLCGDKPGELRASPWKPRRPTYGSETSILSTGMPEN